jgi:tetratricopeptide (TPR) repeat protein
VHVLQEAAALFSRRYPDDQSHVGSYMFLAQAHMALEEPDEALEAAESAVKATAFLPQEVGDERASAYSLRASVLDRLGDVDRAEHDYAQASSLYLAAVGSQHFLYLTNESLRGVALHKLGRRDEGLHVAETSAAELSRVRPQTNSEANGFLRLAGVYERDGQLDRALATSERAFAVLQTTQPPPAAVSNTLTQTARLRMLMGDLDAAARLVDEAVSRAKNANALTAQVEADASIVRGDIAIARGDHGGALALARRAQSLSGGDAFSARLRLARATLLESRASPSSRALELVTSVLSMIESLPAPGDALLQADALTHSGSLMCASGRVEDGGAALKKALTLRQRFEHPQSPRTAAAQQALSSCR